MWVNEPVAPARAAVQRSLIEVFVAHALRCEQVFFACNGRILPEHFDAHAERIYQIIWGAAVRHFQTYNVLPNYEILSAQVNYDLHGLGLVDMHGQEADDFLRWVWSDAWTEQTLQPATALTWARQFLEDRCVHDYLRRVYGNAAQDSVADLPRLLGDMQTRLSTIASLGTVCDRPTIPEIWEDGAGPPMPTGVPLFDTRMEGGTYPGEVNVILAPTGVGKTLTSIQLICAQAQLQYAKEQQQPGSGGLCVMISYEAPMRELVARVMACGAQIDYTTALSLRSSDELSTSANLKDYERRLQRQQLHNGEPVYGERERLQRIRPWANTFIELADFSGAFDAHNVRRGDNGPMEIRQYLDALTRRKNRPIAMVVIDWAGTAIERHLVAQNKDPVRYKTSELNSYVDRIRLNAAVPFSCPAWITHQLSGESNSHGPAWVPHHSNAAECRSFANMAYFAFCFGNKDMRTSCCLFAATKTRRGQVQPPALCLVNGQIGRMEDASAQYFLEARSKRIVSRREAEAVQEHPGATPAQELAAFEEFDRVSVELHE